jgi:hypothetical protein
MDIKGLILAAAILVGIFILSKVLPAIPSS